MKSIRATAAADGFSLTELLISLLILIPIMGAVFSLFSGVVTQNNTEQSSAEMTQEARSALEMMTQEIAQAGSHRDVDTTSTGQVVPSANAQQLPVGAPKGFTVGDWVDVGDELVQVTAVDSNSISAIFAKNHPNGTPVRLYAQPYTAGVLPTAGLGANSSATTNRLRFFGDVNGDGQLNYVEYKYDSANALITRSSTPLTQANKNAALPFINNVKSNSASFTLYTDKMGIVTSVSLNFTVKSPLKTGSKYQETPLSATVAIPSAVAGSTLLYEYERYGGMNRLPPTPAKLATWSYQ